MPGTSGVTEKKEPVKEQAPEQEEKKSSSCEIGKSSCCG